MAYTNCENTIGPDEVLCDQTHCKNYEQTSSMKRVCYCVDWKGNPIEGCQKKGDSFPVSTTECYNKATGQRRNITPEKCDELRDQDKNWGNRTCYCCCSCFAWGTKVAVGQGQVREIQEIGIGETVLTGSLQAGGGTELVWTPRQVVFSDGTSPKEGQIVVLIQYGADGEIVVTTDQPFLMPDGTLKRADRLTFEDQLVDQAGQPVQISAVYLGKAKIGLHNIAAEVAGTSLDGHLLDTNGVVAGDHTVRALQGSDAFARYFAPGHDDLPAIGSAEYGGRRKGGKADQFHSRRNGDQRAYRHAFVPMEAILSAPVPYGAVPFVTAAQAKDIRENGEFHPLTTGINRAEFQYLERLFSGFIPDILFSLNWDDQDPNLFVFESFGSRVVYVSGALLRAKCIQRQGLALLMAHGIARFIGAPPGGLDGIACTGQADYFAIGYLFNDVFYGESTQWGLEALRQIGKLFGWILPANAGGSNRCMDPSIRCRLDALNAALAGQELPYCAGAPTVGTLKLETAVLQQVEGAATVVATFSDALFAGSLDNVTNYQIRPVTVVTAALRNLRDLKQVVLNVVLPDNQPGPYTLTVSNILAIDGSTLDPSQASATFDVP